MFRAGHVEYIHLSFSSADRVFETVLLLWQKQLRLGYKFGKHSSRETEWRVSTSSFPRVLHHAASKVFIPIVPRIRWARCHEFTEYLEEMELRAYMKQGRVTYCCFNGAVKDGEFPTILLQALMRKVFMTEVGVAHLQVMHGLLSC